MIEEGIVIENNDKIKIEIIGHDDTKCGNCNLCKKTNEKRIIELNEKYEFKPGDKILVEYDSGNYTILMSIFFIVPILFLLFSYLFFNQFISDEIILMLLSFFMCFLSIFVIVINYKHFQKKILKIKLSSL